MKKRFDEVAFFVRFLLKSTALGYGCEWQQSKPCRNTGCCRLVRSGAHVLARYHSQNDSCFVLRETVLRLRRKDWWGTARLSRVLKTSKVSGYEQRGRSLKYGPMNEFNWDFVRYCRACCRGPLAILQSLLTLGFSLLL